MIDSGRIDGSGSFGRTRRAVVRLLVLLSLAGLTPGAAGAVDFDVEFRTTGYQVQPTDTFDDLKAQHDSGSLLGTVSLTTLSGVSAPVAAQRGPVAPPRRAGRPSACADLLASLRRCALVVPVGEQRIHDFV